MAYAPRVYVWIATPILLSIFCCLVSAQQPATPLNLQTAPPTSGQVPSTADGDTGWHLALSPYLWFAGSHGTVGALGRDVSIRASPGDLLSHFDIEIGRAHV